MTGCLAVVKSRQQLPAFDFGAIDRRLLEAWSLLGHWLAGFGHDRSVAPVRRDPLLGIEHVNMSPLATKGSRQCMGALPLFTGTEPRGPLQRHRAGRKL